MRSIHKLAHIWTAICLGICPGCWCQPVPNQQNDCHNSKQNQDEKLITQLGWKVDNIPIIFINMNRCRWAILLLCTNNSENTANKFNVSTHWCRVTHICVSKFTSVGSGDGLSPRWLQAINWTNAGILLTWPRGTNFNGMLIGIHIFSSKKYVWKCRLKNGRHFA